MELIKRKDTAINARKLPKNVYFEKNRSVEH